MFNIDNLMTPTIKERFGKLKDIRSQAVFLLRLINYTREFSDDADEISAFCKKSCNEVYDTTKFYKIKTVEDFIQKYALRVRDMNKVKVLINALCSDLIDDMEQFDDIIDKAQGTLDLVQSIDDYEFSNGTPTKQQAETVKKKSLKDIMKYKMIVAPPKEKKEKKKK